MSINRSPCPIARSLDLLGDRWSLLVIRDLLRGKRIYSEFLDSPERISTNLLADRLKKLEAAGVIERERYQDHPPRHTYSLTDAGNELQAVLDAMTGWGLKHLPGTATFDQLA